MKKLSGGINLEVEDEDLEDHEEMRACYHRPDGW